MDVQNVEKAEKAEKVEKAEKAEECFFCYSIFSERKPKVTENHIGCTCRFPIHQKCWERWDIFECPICHSRVEEEEQEQEEQEQEEQEQQEQEPELEIELAEPEIFNYILGIYTLLKKPNVFLGIIFIWYFLIIL